MHHILCNKLVCSVAKEQMRSQSGGVLKMIFNDNMNIHIFKRKAKPKQKQHRTMNSLYLYRFLL